MTEDDDPPIILEPAPAVTPLSGNESEPDAATLAAACWLLRRYSSHTYIERAYTLFRGVVDAFAAWPDASERCSPETLRTWERALHGHQAAYERGLALLKRGRAAAAYAAIAEAVSGLEPEDPRDDLHFSLRLLLDELGPAAALGGQRAGAMAQRIDYTLKATWAYERILANRPSLRLLPRRLPEHLPTVSLPDSRAPEVETGRDVPQTGIWLPVTILSGCPNFLVAGGVAPPVTRACERIDYAALPGSTEEPPQPAWSDYEFTTEDTVWRLVWPDPRYHGDRIDDEPAFLDEDNALP